MKKLMLILLLAGCGGQEPITTETCPQEPTCTETVRALTTLGCVSIRSYQDKVEECEVEAWNTCEVMATLCERTWR